MGVASGLCSVCDNSRRVVTKRGGVFRLCKLSKTDPNFPRYPVLPVLECKGFERASESGRSSE
ncbi:MAG: hypothetical protein J4G12_06235 [Gemmatimonadetes bacterium]|nr:hypothetical protein [Gemmatimonadota bacterium]